MTDMKKTKDVTVEVAEAKVDSGMVRNVTSPKGEGDTPAGKDASGE